MRTGRYITLRRECGTASKRMATQGISLTELLVVLALLGIMAAAVIPSLSGAFSSNDTQLAVAELYKLMEASRVYAATYRVDAGLAYGVSLRHDSFSGAAVEAVDAVALVYKLPEQIAKRCFFYSDMDGNDLPTPLKVSEDIYVPVVGEHERGFFRKLPGEAVLLADNLLPDGSRNPDLAKTLKPIRIYRVTQIEDRSVPEWRCFSAQLVAPLRIGEDNAEILDNLPPELQYLAGITAGAKFLEYKPDLVNAPDMFTVADFRFPAHIFTSSGRMNTDTSSFERFVISVGYAPDADPRERFVNSTDPSNGLRTKDIEVFRGTGRASVIVD